MKKSIALLFCLIFLTCLTAQDEMTELPYYQIPDYPEKYTNVNVAARMIDGLGFRYYWASEGLREEDLNYKPSEDARTTRATIEHIYGLSRVILNASKNQANEGSLDYDISFAEMRKNTLNNIKTASDILKNSKKKDLKKKRMIFKRKDRTNEFPYWNAINGPIADAIWHCGQLVSFRRASGNPFNSKVSVLRGKVRE
ncbi:MAG: hypothetical protein AAFZ15_21670 [Bacteroidota bacterium]